MGSRRLYGDEFKDQAVRLVKDTGDSIPSIAADLGISAVNLRRWVRESRDSGAGSSLSKDEAAELVRLRRENKKLKAQRDILKKATALFATDLN